MATSTLNRPFKKTYVSLTKVSGSNQLRNNNVTIPDGYSLIDAVVAPLVYSDISLKIKEIQRVSTTGFIALPNNNATFSDNDSIDIRVIWF